MKEFHVIQSSSTPPHANIFDASIINGAQKEESFQATPLKNPAIYSTLFLKGTCHQMVFWIMGIEEEVTFFLKELTHHLFRGCSFILCVKKEESFFTKSLNSLKISCQHLLGAPYDGTLASACRQESPFADEILNFQVFYMVN